MAVAGEEVRSLAVEHARGTIKMRTTRTKTKKLLVAVSTPTRMLMVKVVPEVGSR